MDKENVFLTAKEVSEDFFNGKWGYQKVLRLTRNGVIPAVKKGKSYLYEHSQLVKWAEVNFSKPAQARIKI